MNGRPGLLAAVTVDAAATAAIPHGQPQNLAGDGLDLVEIAAGLRPHVGHGLVAADAHADLVARHGELLAAEGVAAGGEQGERAGGEHADDKGRVAAGLRG